jgi:hypothetical protein
LDFFYLLLKKVTYEYFDQKDDSDQSISKAFNTHQYRNALNNQFSVTFYGAFRSDADFYGANIVDNLYKICQETGKKNFFNGYLKISKSNKVYSMPTTKERFTPKFFSGKVTNESEKFLICGPPRMM